MNKYVSFSAVNSYESIQLIEDLISLRLYHYKSEEKAIIGKILFKTNKTQKSPITAGCYSFFLEWVFWAGFYANLDLNKIKC